MSKIKLDGGFKPRVPRILARPRGYQAVFHPSSQHMSLRQQVITLAQTYPCPRCTAGVLEPYGMTETLSCNACKRGFVPLRGGRFLYPATLMGWKIAPTFWWDGFRWHWGGTTATARQLSAIVLLSLLPVIGVLSAAPALPRHPLCEPCLLALAVGLVSMQLIYLMCWDFDFFSRHKAHFPDEAVGEPR